MSIHHDRMLESILSRLVVGRRIFTADGEPIGTLAEVRHQHLKVNAPRHRDYWIDAAQVRVCDSERIELAFNNDDLGAHRADDPGHPIVHGVPEDGIRPGLFASTATSAPDMDRSNGDQANRNVSQTDPLLEQKNDFVVSESEQMNTRMRMEGGLVEQRRREGAPTDTPGTIGEPVESELARLEDERGKLERQTFSAPAFSSSRDGSHSYGSRWLLLAGIAVLVGVTGAGMVLRRRRKTRHHAQIAETARDVRDVAESGVQTARTMLNNGLRGAIARIR